MRFAIRAYRPEDFRILWEIDQSCFAPGISYSKFELKSYILRAEAFTIVAEERLENQARSEIGDSESPSSASVLGFLVGERTRRGVGHIITIDVLQRGRRHGVGSALLREAERKFREVNCSAIRLETAVDNMVALSFYKRHGYHVIRTIPRYYSNAVDALLLEKDRRSLHAGDLR